MSILFTPGDTPAPRREPDPSLRVEIAGPTDVDATAEPAKVAHVDGEIRYRVLVHAIKIPEVARDEARRLMPDRDAVAARRFTDCLGADRPDTDPEFPAGDPERLDGARVFYEVDATADEIDRMRSASNAISVQVSPLVRAI